jgi:3-O-alpha-D-mannopyranosyl-alpha-D-mannopyranose xylosylphosphotransferase
MDGVMHQRNGDPDTCIFDFDTCLPPNFFPDPAQPVEADYMFTHLAFAEPRCGDCMIKALVSASGPRGLSAVLPRVTQTIEPETRRHRRWERSEPILPLDDTWQLTNFSAYSIIRPNQDQWRGSRQEPNERVNLQQWCIKLLSRYAYTVGSTAWQFDLIQNMDDLEKTIREIDDPYGERAALACLNDDQPDDADDAVRVRYAQWMEEKWGDVDAQWEKKGMSWL